MTEKFLVPVELPGDPASALHAAPKQYVDAHTQLTVKDFGAVGDSTWINGVFTPGTDDTAALIAAHNSDQLVLLPPPDGGSGYCYRITSDILADPATSETGGLVGTVSATKWVFSSDATPPPVGMIVYDGPDVDSAVICASSEAVGVQPATDTFATRMNGYVLKDVILNGNGLARYGLWGAGMQDFQIEHVYGINCKTVGISLNGSYSGVVVAARCGENDGRGMEIGGAYDRYSWDMSGAGAFNQDNAIRLYDPICERNGGGTLPATTTVAAGSNGDPNTDPDLFVASLTGLTAPGWVTVFDASVPGDSVLLHFTGTSTSGGNHLTGVTVVSGDAFNYATGDSVALTDDRTFLSDNCGLYIHPMEAVEIYGGTFQSNFGVNVVNAPRGFGNNIDGVYTELGCSLDNGDGTAIEQGFASQQWGLIVEGVAAAEGNKVSNWFIQEDSIWLTGTEPAGHGFELDNVHGWMTAGKNNLRADWDNYRLVNCSPEFADHYVVAADGVTYPPTGVFTVAGELQSPVLSGGTANTDDLTLRATSHATPLQGAYITCVQGLNIRPTAETIAYAPTLLESIYAQITQTVTLNAGAAANRMGSGLVVAPTAIWNQGGIAGSTVAVGIQNIATHKTAADTAISVVNLFAASNTLTITGNGDVFTATLGIAFSNTGNATVEGDAGAGVALTAFEGYRGNYGTIGTGCTVTTLSHISLKNPTAPTGTLTTLIALDIANQTRATTNIGIRNAATTVFTSTSYAVGAGGGSVTVTSTYVKLTGVNAGTMVLGNPSIATTGAQNGQVVTIQNTDSADSVTFVHGNSVTLPRGVNLTLAPGETADFIFDGTNWVCIAAPWRSDQSGLFGDGSSGALAFDGSSAVTGCSRSGTVYTLTQDLYATSMTLSGTVTQIKTDNFRIFVRGVLLASVSCIISNDGVAGAAGVGGVSSAIKTLTPGSNGGDGIVASAGAAGLTSGAALGASGGAGGGATGGPGTGGGTAGGVATAVTAAFGGPGVHHAHAAIGGGSAAAATYPIFFTAGAGGSGGTAASGTGIGGGGGGGGGLVMIAASAILVATGVTLTLRSNGGAGGNGTAGTSAGTGGGGGGGGGAVMLVYGTQSIIGTLTLTVTGGAGGTLTGTGKTGAAGSTGNSYQIAA